MGQKVNPHGLRVGIIKDWDSRWYASDEKFGDILVSDYKIRKHLKEKLKLAGVPKIEIERANGRIKVFIHCAKPGMVIGRGGTEIDKIKTEIEQIVGMPASVNVIEVKPIDLNAQLVAENIASQLERRISFRRAMKQAIARAMRCGAKGIKTCCSGRLGGAEIARSEHYHEGTIPLHTLRADIDYGFWEANTQYGKIGVKVWIYKGEVLPEIQRTVSESPAASHRQKHESERRDRRERRDGGRRKSAGNAGNKGAKEGGRK
ncbi:MAG: 30S ribosomal protein S3 [Eubacteriales bacterium]|jgi:small subunit ribosomal protein S3|nr:30S ribosomal protein S3 [Clostridiales bacterium]